MRIKTIHLMIFAFVMCGVIGIWSGDNVMAQETPTETPIETPTVAPTDTPEPTNTPEPGETPTETPTATPEASPTEVGPTESPTATPEASPTEVGPTESPTATPEVTPTPAEETSLTLSGGTVAVGEEIVVDVAIENASAIDAFAFDIQQSNPILSLVSVETAGTLTEEFLLVDARENNGTVTIAGIGGDGVAEGDGLLVQVRYSANEAGDTDLTITNLIDDIEGATLAGSTVTVTGETPTEVPTPEVTPTETATEVPTPEVTPTETATPTPAATGTPTPTSVPDRTPIPVFTPTPTPTALVLNPSLGLVGYDHLGGTYPRGNAAHNFDVGITDPQSLRLVAPGVFDGFPDPVALSPYLVINFTGTDQTIIPIAQDIEFTGEVLPLAQGGNGSEGVYFLIGGNIGPFPPVNPRLGATGGPLRGGIDIDNDPSNNINFGIYSGDIIPVYFNETTESYESILIDIEAAGNDGFYVLTSEGNIIAEGDADASLETSVDMADGAVAVSLKVYRGSDVIVTNSIYSENLNGSAAYVLSSDGVIHTVGTAPAVVTENIPSGLDYKDIELVPNPEGTEFIGLGVLTGDGMVHFAPFETTTVTTELEDYITNLSPFGSLANGFPFDLARDIEVEISEFPVYGLNTAGETVEITGRRVGMFLFDGFGGIFTGGDSTRFAPALVTSGGTRIINGQQVVPFPVSVPFFGVDVLQDVEIAWPVNRQQ